MLRPLRRVSRISDARSETTSIATTACGNSSSTLAWGGYSAAPIQVASRGLAVWIEPIPPPPEPVAASPGMPGDPDRSAGIGSAALLLRMSM